MANTTWNPADLTNLTLSGGNLVATASSGNGGVRAVDRFLTGKYYFEVTETFSLGGGTMTIGVANANANLSTGYNAPTNVATVFNNSGSSIFVNSGTAVGSLGVTLVTGNIISVALDLDNKRIWFRLAPSGNWNGSGTANPATNTGGFDITALFGGGSLTIGPAAFFGSSGSRVATANFGNTAFSGAVPAGFTSGFPNVPPVNYVDFSGNLGAVSLYGKLLYGAALYSRGGAFTPTFAGDFDLIGQANFIGDLAPIVSFAGNLTFRLDLGGDLAPSVTFGGDLTFTLSLAGNVAPSVMFGGDLSLLVDLVPLAGSFVSNVVFGASSFTSGPLWADAAPCPPPLWTEAEPCPSSLWTPVDCGQATWQKVELCNG